MNLRYRVIDYFLSKPTKDECHEVLMEWSNFYQRLEEEAQREFAIRTLIFLRSVQFESEPGFEVTQEMKIMLGSAFVQITFGLKQEVLDHFTRIFIFSEPYTYKNMNTLFNGDVNPLTRTINLSWPAIERGFIVPTEGMNLALHEFGHCLILENSQRLYLLRTLNANRLKEWQDLAVQQLISIRRGQSGIFRGYAGTNLMELFSVAMETFFERPYAFFADSPEFYKSTCLLLNQDPREPRNPTRFLRSL